MDQGIQLAKTIAPIAVVVVPALALIVAVVACAAAWRSAAASQKSAQVAQDALDHSVRQWRVTITPRVTAVIMEVFRDRMRGMALELINSGRGEALNVAYKVNVTVVTPRDGEVSAAPQEGVTDHLPAGARFEIHAYYYARPLLADGSIVYEDIEGTRYRSHYDAGAKKWAFEVGVQ